MIRKPGARELGLLPVASFALPLQEPLQTAHQMRADAVLAGQQFDHRPRGLRRRAGAAPAPGRILVAETALAPSAVLVLFRLEPRDRTLDPRLARADANRTQSRKRRAGAVNVVDAPTPPP